MMDEFDYEEYLVTRSWEKYHERMKKTEVRSDDGYDGCDELRARSDKFQDY